MSGKWLSTSTSAAISTAAILVSSHTAGAHGASHQHLRHGKADDDPTRDYAYLGCYKDKKRDRILGHQLTDDVNVKADHEMCGGHDAFDLYRIGTNTSGDDDDDGNHGGDDSGDDDSGDDDSGDDDSGDDDSGDDDSGDDDSGDDDSGDDDSGDDDSGDDDSGDDDGVSTPPPLTLTPSPTMDNGDDYGIFTSSPVNPTPSPTMDSGDDEGVFTPSPPTLTPSPAMDNGYDDGTYTLFLFTPAPSSVTDSGDDDSIPAASSVSPVPSSVSLTPSPVPPTPSPITHSSEPASAPVDGAFVDDIVKIIVVEGQDPGRNWEDSYSVGGKCFMYSNFDHGIHDFIVDTPLGNMTVETLFGLMGPGPGADGRPLYNDIQCGNGPANTAIDETTCPGLVQYGRAGCGQIGPKWDLSEIRFEDDDYEPGG
eukprot:g3908.t1